MAGDGAAVEELLLGGRPGGWKQRMMLCAPLIGRSEPYRLPDLTFHA